MITLIDICIQPYLKLFDFVQCGEEDNFKSLLCDFESYCFLHHGMSEYITDCECLKSYMFCFCIMECLNILQTANALNPIYYCRLNCQLNLKQLSTIYILSKRKCKPHKVQKIYKQIVIVVYDCIIYRTVNSLAWYLARNKLVTYIHICSNVFWYSYNVTVL